MSINIKATGIELTPAIREYLENKIMSLGKLVDFSSDNVLVEAGVGRITGHHRTGEVFKAEVNLTVAGQLIRVKAVEADLYAAIDKVKDELSNKLSSDQKKKITLVRKGGRMIKNLLKKLPYRR
jgi:ribosomal subunit interface protein